jgi:hypothetical protein
MVAARKEVIVGRVLAFSDDPPDDAHQDGKVRAYDYPIPGSKCRLAKNLECCHKSPFQICFRAFVAFQPQQDFLSDKLLGAGILPISVCCFNIFCSSVPIFDVTAF